MCTFFYVFLRFFSKSKKHDFLRFFELLHTFSRTVPTERQTDTGENVTSSAEVTNVAYSTVTWPNVLQPKSTTRCCTITECHHERRHLSRRLQLQQQSFRQLSETAASLQRQKQVGRICNRFNSHCVLHCFLKMLFLRAAWRIAHLHSTRLKLLMYKYHAITVKFCLQS